MGSLFQTGVIPLINDYLLEQSKQKRDYGDYWSASSAGYCMRKVIFERLGVPHVETESDARKQRMFTAGHLFHDWIQGITKEAGLSVAQEVELQDEDLMIRGHFDDLILIRYDENGETPVRVGAEQRAQHLILYDYKTVNSRSFLWSKRNGSTMSHFHRLQLGTYMYMLRKSTRKFMLGYSLDEARILKIEKDTLMMEEQQLLWKPDLEKDVVGYWSTLNGYWKNKKIPKCTCADYEGGFMAKEKFNPFYYNGEPCSLEWYELYKSKKEASNV